LQSSDFRQKDKIMSENEQKAEQILFDRGILMSLFIGKPTFQKKLKQGDILVEGIDSSAIYLGHKYLLSKKATEDLVNIEGRARRALADKSMEFPLSGGRFVNYHALPEISEELAELKLEWENAVRELIASYDTLKSEQLAVLDRQCETLMSNQLSKTPFAEKALQTAKLTSWLEQQKINNRNLYPLAEQLPELFKFQWRVFKLSAPTGLEEMSTLDQRMLAEAQQALQRDLQLWVRTASMEMHRALGEAAANALQMLDKNKKLNPRNLKPLFDAFETFKAVDFTGASSFQEVVANIKSTFGIIDAQGNLDYERIADQVSNTQSMSTFRGLLAKVSELATDQVAETAGIEALRSVGEFKRIIEV
jgi:hypothetical protein